MEALILAAGYATRLGELTANRAKPLLPIGSKPMIDFIYGQMALIPEIQRVSVVTNDKFAAQFMDWAAGHAGETPISVLNDGTNSDTNKLGAVGDIKLTIERHGIDDDLLIVAGDNLFDFELQQLVDFFHGHGTSIGLYDVGDLELMTQYSAIQVDPSNQRILEFIEKPKHPQSTLAATALYAWRRDHLPFIQTYASEGGNMDAPGYVHQWLTKQVDVYGFRIPGEWRDIGNREQYETACQEYLSRASVK